MWGGDEERGSESGGGKANDAEDVTTHAHARTHTHPSLTHPLHSDAGGGGSDGGKASPSALNAAASQHPVYKPPFSKG